MNNILKITNLLIIALLNVVALVLYQKYNNDFFLNFVKFSFSALLLFSFVIFRDSFYNLFLSLKKTFKNRRFKKAESQKTKNFSFETIWEDFFQKSKIAAIYFNEEGSVLGRNEHAEDLIESIPELVRDDISEIFDITPQSYLNLSSLHSSIISDTTLNNKDKDPFSIFISKAPNNYNKEQIFIAQIIDNKEKFDLKEKFIQAQKMQAIGQLAGGVAHDFNNLLTAIIGFADLLLTRHSPGDKDFIDIMHIKQNANRAANLVRQLLAFSRKQTMNMEVINVTNILTELSNLIRRLIGEDVNLNLSYGSDLWDIKADRSQLEQVLINLAVNSRDAIENSGGNLKITAENKEIFSIRDVKFKYNNFAGSEDIEPGKYVMLSIEDDGCGISKENLKKIFEPFFTTKKIGHGTGLGLATVTGIVDQTGGYIFVNSSENEGTQFLIFLKKEESKRTLESESTEPPKKESKDLSGSGVILVVEDEEPVRMFSTRALKNKGYKVYEAYSGENALDVIEEIGIDKIDIIVSDVVMPGISGPEMAEEIKKKRPDIKIIFVSGYGEDAFYQKYGYERKFEFLPKPYSLNQLAQRVKDSISS